MTIPERGEIWLVDLNPTRGAEMNKCRTCVVMNDRGLGRLPLHLVVPLTEWKADFAAYSWFVKVQPDKSNALKKLSGADALQIRSVDRERFVKRIGQLPADRLEEITFAIALVIGFDPHSIQQ